MPRTRFEDDPRDDDFPARPMNGSPLVPLLWAMALAAGALIPVQAAANAALARSVGGSVPAAALVLFAVAAATTGVILQNPGATAFVRSWSVGEGLLPAAALCGYILIASGITTHTTQVFPRVPSWTPRRVRW